MSGVFHLAQCPLDPSVWQMATLSIHVCFPLRAGLRELQAKRSGLGCISPTPPSLLGAMLVGSADALLRGGRTPSKTQPPAQVSNDAGRGQGWLVFLTPEEAGGVRTRAVWFSMRDSPCLSKLFIHCSLWKMGAYNSLRVDQGLNTFCREDDQGREAHWLNPRAHLDTSSMLWD